MSRSRGDSYAGYRAKLVEAVRQKGVRDLAVLRAVGEVPRHLFIPPALLSQAYEDTSLPIGNAQTISQPSTHARAIEALRLGGRERVLEVGTGSGYQTALLAMCTGQVFSIERVSTLAEQARRSLAEAGVSNVSIMVGDGTLGWRAFAPYDAVLVSAGAPEVPAPLVEQLAPGGRIVIPLGRREMQVLSVVAVAPDGTLTRTPVAEAAFVPLFGTHGFHA